MISVKGETAGQPADRRKLNWFGSGKYLVLAAAWLWLPLAPELRAQNSAGEAAAREYQINQPGQRPAVVKSAPANRPRLPDAPGQNSNQPGRGGGGRQNSGRVTQLEGGADETLVLSKTIEVQEYAGRKFAAEQYQVKSGDTLYSILSRRGLIERGRANPETLAAIKAVNPGLKDLNRLSPGQILILPSESLALSPAAGRDSPPQAPDNIPAKPLGYYQVTQTGQQPAQVTILEASRPQAKPQPAGLGARKDQAPAAGGPVEPPLVPAAASQNQRALNQTAEGISYRTITVKSGDTLERILRREGLPVDLIYRQMLKITVDLNNNLKNPNLIVAGMELKIPVQGEYLAKYEAIPAPKRTPQAPAGRLQTAKAADKAPAGGGMATAKAPAGGEAPAKRPKQSPTPTLPSARSEAAKTALTMILARLGENVNSNSQLFLPLGDGGQLDIDTANFPVLELNNGRRIILDLDDRLPKAMVEALGRHYDYYEVLKAGKNESLSQTLDKLWAACRYFRVYKKGQPFEGGRQVVLKLEADWLIWPTSEAWSKGQPIVINVISDPQKVTPDIWLNFLAQNGIKVIDIHDQGALVGRQAEAVGPVDGDLAERKIKLVEIKELKPAALAGRLLEALGEEYESGAPLDLELPNSKGAGFSLTVAAPIILTQGNKKTILDFGEMPHDVTKVLREQGYKVIIVPPDPVQVIQAVCDVKGIKLKPGLTIKNNTGAGPDISLTITGQSFNYQGREFLATNMDVPQVVTPLISESPLVVIKYPTAQG